MAEALADAYGAVNVVSLYVEHGRETFHSVHVESAQRVAIQAQRAGVERLIHVSGIGADPRSRSPYIRKRGEGELAVRAAYADALLIRSAVMFGPDDALLTTLIKLPVHHLAAIYYRLSCPYDQAEGACPLVALSLYRDTGA